MEDEKIYTIHCSNCVRVLGVSVKHIQKKLHNPKLYCMDCIKEKLNSQIKPKTK